ncbi:MAG: hypothetical protein ACLQMU_04260 [Methanoregula sp.]|uniref:hypothetical protein n=1 Tax=Methanoregula sp. TaxID=2052170 RepID=UPI003FD70D60
MYNAVHQKNSTTAPTVSLQPPVTEAIPVPTVTATPTIDQPDETTLATFLKISGTGSNFVADSMNDVPAYQGVDGNYSNQYKTGTLHIFGNVDSRSEYNLNVSIDVDTEGSSLYDSIIVPASGTTGFTVSMPYTAPVGQSSFPYYVSIIHVSIVPTTPTK